MSHSLRRSLPLTVLALFLALTAGSVPAHCQAESEIDDSDIIDAIETELIIDDGVSSHLIDVSVIDGIVTLSGTVSTMMDRERAAILAESIKGVRAVVNQVSVKPIERSDADIKDDIVTAIMADTVTESWEIDVSVADGTVTLGGTTDNWAEKRFAERLSSGIKGVKKIRNNITVDYDPSRTDYEIRSEIEAILEWDAYVDNYFIEVSVEDGRASLTGTVGSAAEKTRARTDAWLGGATSVDDSGLEVEPWAKPGMERDRKYIVKADKDIKDALEDALLFDPRVAFLNVDVEVDNGRVVLDGIVEDLRAKNAAAEDAENTTGVWHVENKLKVRPAGAPSDSVIQENVAEALVLDPVVERFDLAIVVRNQKVYLYGTVDTYFEKIRAEGVAASVGGVVDISNNLTVNYDWMWKSDEEIAEDIESELFWSVFVDGSDVVVTVDNGVATLSGVVDSWQEYNAAVDNAFDGGARMVSSQLQVAGVPGYSYRLYETRDDISLIHHGYSGTVWMH
jgi:osmotically-inducible protein OsmY